MEVEDESAVDHGSQKGQSYFRLHQAQHVQPTEGMDFSTMFCIGAVLPQALHADLGNSIYIHKTVREHLKENCEDGERYRTQRKYLGLFVLEKRGLIASWQPTALS